MPVIVAKSAWPAYYQLLPTGVQVYKRYKLLKVKQMLR